MDEAWIFLDCDRLLRAMLLRKTAFVSESLLPATAELLLGAKRFIGHLSTVQKQ